MSNNVQSRTKKGVRNSIVALGFYLINLILQFVSRRVFINYLGTEVLGLNTTIVSILQFLNLAEMGIGPAIACTLYKPLLEKDYNTINEIIAVQGKLYRLIAYFIIVGSAIVLLFFPQIFAKAEVPLWYAYATYIVMLISSLLGYFYNYKQVIVSADQQDYKIQISYKLAMLLKLFFQVVAVTCLDNGYVYWIFLELVFSIIGTIWLNKVIYKSYPYLKEANVYTKGLLNKYPDIIKKIKQLFFHKVSYYVSQQVSSLIIYAYASLTLVSIYGNYMLIITGIVSLMAALSNGLNGGVGNLVAEGNKTKILHVFRELFSVRFYLIAVVTFGFWIFSDSFISLWVGNEMILDKACLGLLTFILFANTFLRVIDTFINAYGLFKDIWAPMVEASINLSLSIALGYHYGLFGILIGYSVSLVFMVIIWKPIFLFTQGFKSPFSNYVRIFGKHFLLCIGSAYGLILLWRYWGMASSVGGQISLIIVYTTFLFVLLLVSEKGFRHFISRFIHRKKTNI